MLRVEGRGSEGRVCSFCRDELAAHEESARCPECGTRFHAECVRELGTACATLGCGGQISVPASGERLEGRWVASKEIAGSRLRDLGLWIGVVIVWLLVVLPLAALAWGSVEDLSRGVSGSLWGVLLPSLPAGAFALFTISLVRRRIFSLGRFSSVGLGYAPQRVHVGDDLELRFVATFRRSARIESVAATVRNFVVRRSRDSYRLEDLAPPQTVVLWTGGEVVRGQLKRLAGAVTLPAAGVATQRDGSTWQVTFTVKIAGLPDWTDSVEFEVLPARSPEEPAEIAFEAEVRAWTEGVLEVARRDAELGEASRYDASQRRVIQRVARGVGSG